MKTFSITNEIDHTHVRFDSFADYVAASAQRNPNPYPTETFTASNSFTAYTTLTNARDLMASGWREGADRIRAVSQGVQQAIPDTVLAAHRPVQVWDVTGLSLDVATFLSGQPECFMDEIVPERGERIDGNGIVRIAVNLSASCGVKAKELETRGVYAAALSDVLELLGYRVQIDGFFCDKAKHIGADGKLTTNLHVLQFPIKRADEALEIDRLSFVLAHPASLRQIGFHVQDVVGYRDSVYGHPRALLAQYHGDVTIGELAWRSNSDVDTANKVLEQLKALGIDLGVEAL
jgi:hypothetical protein